MTRDFNGFGEPTPFSNWLRALAAPLDSRTINNQNLDYVWHNYRRNYLLTIEEKRYRGTSSDAQKDTHRIIEQMLRASDGLLVQTMRGIRPARYFGHHVVQFENTTPDDGGMWINGRASTEDDLLALLSFETSLVDA